MTLFWTVDNMTYFNITIYSNPFTANNPKGVTTQMKALDEYICSGTGRGIRSGKIDGQLGTSWITCLIFFFWALLYYIYIVRSLV